MTTEKINQHELAKSLLSPWWYFLVGDLFGLGALWIHWHDNLQLPTHQFIAAALVLWITTTLAAAPLIRFVIFDWKVRYHEFRNRLNNESLIAYLQQFWERRTTEDPTFSGWNADVGGMEKIFDAIYREQYGRMAFIAPMVLLNSAIFILITLSILIYMEQITLALNIDATVAIASIAGAYMYVVSDAIQSVRQRSLSASSIYWYVLRMLLAIPFGVALTHPLAGDVKPFVAFGLGALPMDDIIKLLRRLTSKQLNLSESAEESDQLIQLEGVTVRIASMLIAEGVDSIEQIIAVDPVLLSIHTGLPFKFILQLGSQAIVRRHLGASAEKLIPLSLADARSIAALVADLDNDKDPAVQNRAKAALELANSLVMPDTATDSQCLELNFRRCTNENYTKFILGKLLMTN